MSRRRADDSSGGVLSFTYLDVLTCTMGTLVLLLVVFGEKAKLAALAEAAGKFVGTPSATGEGEAPAEPDGKQLSGSFALPAEDAAKQLAEVRKRQAELERIRADAVEKIKGWRQQISHLEDHERRLEHELAQLHIVLDRLQGAEQQNRVDQETAEKDLAHLKELIADTEKQLAEAQSEKRQRSFAIVPYKGANGTTRRPIYIECTADAVIIQPEGIRLTAADFDGPLRSGNPLAAAVRAAREDLNSRQAAGGEAADPYPLLIVRPDGSGAYSAALDAIRGWDAEFGYEFVEADMQLEFPMADPRLEQVMSHAVDQARTRQALLARAAPRQYGSRLGGIGSGPGEGGGGDGMDLSAGGDGRGREGGGFDAIAQSGGAGDRIGERAGDGSMSMGQGGAAGVPQQRYGSGGRGSGGGSGNFSDQFAGGSPSAEGSDGATSAGGSAGDNRYAMGQAAGGGGVAGGAAGGAQNALATSGQAYSSASSTSGTASAGPPPDVHDHGSNSREAGTGGAVGSTNGGSGQSVSMVEKRSMAETRGANWANAQASRRAAAITRPIQVIVRAGELVVLTEGESVSSAANDTTVVTFDQPTDKVMDKLAGTLKEHIDRWGLAGRDMYWRPLLVLQVAPGADQQAARLSELLENSGVDVRLPQTAARPTEDSTHAR